MRLMDLFSKHQRWTKNTWARKNNGEECDVGDKGACRYCLEGGLQYCYPDNSKRWQVQEKLHNALTSMGWSGIIEFNDSKQTTFQDIRKLVTKLKV
jgi:hypothetical protein